MDANKLTPITLDMEYPTLSDRVQSTFIDAVAIVALLFACSSLLEKYEDSAPDWIRIALFFGIWAVYEPLGIALGSTLGNYIKGIRVRKASDPGRKINIIQAFLRYLLKFSLGWISFLSIHFNPQRRALHDLAAGSVMIRKQS